MRTLRLTRVTANRVWGMSSPRMPGRIYPESASGKTGPFEYTLKARLYIREQTGL